MKGDPNLVAFGRFQCLMALEKFQCLVVFERFQCLVVFERFQCLVVFERFQCLVANGKKRRSIFSPLHISSNKFYLNLHFFL